ncbi:MAG TPA: SDR family NAD(P)-dependent oxidoreductase [Sphingomonadaceae bacterium]|nr:SDR family NAD(P)-dependent oxidoreductase [Sphingomonadaceae bacterium]
MAISFTDRVAIVTGAGGGIGRACALELARRGARILVNDLGGTREGAGHSDSAHAVVAEIEAAGGVALADSGDVTDPAQMAAMVEKAVSAWGGVHILVNNAGILRDRSFAKMSVEDFRDVVDVDLNGAAIVTRAAWNLMREQGYGRILMMASATGLYGNFGQANYGAAKLGLVGLAKTLHLEGAKYGIRVNTLVPVAGTRMTDDILPPEIYEAFAPENVVPAALYLVSDDAPTNMIVGAGGGVFHAAYVTMTPGILLPPGERTSEGVAARWGEIADRAGATAPQSGAEQSLAIISRLQEE